MMTRSFLLIAFLAILVPTLALPADTIDKRQSDGGSSCNVTGSIREHGEIFSLHARNHCKKYRCDNGSLKVHEKACENMGRCYPLGISYDELDNCKTVRCARVYGHRYTKYKLVMTQPRHCKDYYGACHDEGSQFTYQINGTLSDRCTCWSISLHSVSYSCW